MTTAQNPAPRRPSDRRTRAIGGPLDTITRIMPERVADHIDRGPLARELSRIGVPEPVGVDPALHAGFADGTGQQPPDIAGVDLPALQGAEHRCPGVWPELASVRPPAQQRCKNATAPRPRPITRGSRFAYVKRAEQARETLQAYAGAESL